MKRIKLAIIICFLFVFSCCSVNAGDGAPAVEWDRTYGAIWGYAVCSSGDGGYVIAGITGDWVHSQYHGYGSWYNDTVLLIKIDAAGEVVWEKNYTRGHVRSVVLTRDGGYAFAGRGVADLIKTDSEGNVQWNRTYAALDDCSVWSLIQTSDGGYAVAGFGDHPVSGTEGVLVKIDSEGNIQWSKTYGELHAYVQFRSVVEAEDGYALAGNIHNYMWLVKTDLDGNVKWDKSYDKPESGGGMAVARTADGGYILAGNTRSSGAGDYDGYVVKTDSYGNLEWNQTYGGPGRDGFNSVVQSMDGGYVLAGQDLVVKVSETGELEWETGFPDKTIRHVIVASDGGYVFAGWKGDPTINNGEVWAVKLESDYAHSEDVLAWFFSADGVTITTAIVAVCVTVIVVSSVIYKRRQTTNKT